MNPFSAKHQLPVVTTEFEEVKERAKVGDWISVPSLPELSGQVLMVLRTDYGTVDARAAEGQVYLIRHEHYNKLVPTGVITFEGHKYIREDKVTEKLYEAVKRTKYSLKALIKASTPEKTREDILTEAYEDLEDLHASYSNLSFYFHSVHSSGIVTCTVCHKESRALIKSGAAKCAEDDVFDFRIGKIIALRRALGLKVPDKYLNVPKR